MLKRFFKAYWCYSNFKLVLLSILLLGFLLAAYPTIFQPLDPLLSN